MRERLSEWAMYFAAVGIALWAAAGILFLLGNQPNERLIALLVIGVLAFALYIYARPGDGRYHRYRGRLEFSRLTLQSTH